MFGNFLEETATGTGATLALAGVTTGNIAFQEKFADGDLVAYVVEDSGGTIKVGGIGAYVSATDDITRADTWNWNGTVYDDSPATNITLSGGTHTVRCDALSDDLGDAGVTSGRIYVPNIFQEMGGTFGASATERIYYAPYPLQFTGTYDAFAFEVTTLGTDARLGLYSSENGLPKDLLAVVDSSFDVSTTGLKSASFDGGAMNLKKGDYFLAYHNSGSVSLRGAQSDSVSSNSLGSTSVGAAANQSVTFKIRTYGAMPDPADITSLSYQAGGFTMGLEAV